MKNIIVTLSLLLLLVSCGGDTKKVKSHSVLVGINPVGWLVEKIAGDKLTVTVMGNESPVDFTPTPSQMLSVEDADLYFKIGVPFEDNWIPKFQDKNKHLKVITLGDQVTKIQSACDGHHHGHDHGHHEHAVDPHVWVSPKNMQLIAKDVLNQLKDYYPEHATSFDENYATLKVEIAETEEHVASKFADKKGKSFLVYHPAWAYLAKDYNLNQLALEYEGKEPSAKELNRIKEEAQKAKVTVVCVQPQFSTSVAEKVATELGAKVITLDPLAKDWSGNIKSVADQLSEAME